MAEEGEVMVEASVVAVAISAAVAILEAAISPVAVAILAVVISVGLAGGVFVATNSRNTEEGILGTGNASSTGIDFGTIPVFFFERPCCLINPPTRTIYPT